MIIIIFIIIIIINQSINQYSFYYQQKQQLTQPQLKYLQECDHYCPGRKLKWLIMKE